jgi:prepilin-type N-terminal cleavage/methylation domain-containing protein
MSRRKGFSLLELMMVLAVALIITAIGLPAAKRTITSYQLDSSGHAVASMLQSVRMAAVKGNAPYYAQANVAGIAGPQGSVIVSVPASRYPAAAGYQANVDPTVAMARNVTVAAGAGPNQAGLEAAAGIVPGTAQVGGDIGFNSRGLPCVQNGGPWSCVTQPPPPAPVAGPVAFEWYMQNSLNGEWVAVTVTPTGRIRSWRGGANGAWQ